MDSSPNPKNYDFIDTLMLEQSSWQTEARVHRMSYRNGCGTQRVTIEIVSWPPPTLVHSLRSTSFDHPLLMVIRPKKSEWNRAATTP